MNLETLFRIKRAVLTGRLVLSVKAREEMEHDDLDVVDVVESIVSARSIRKTIRSTGLLRSGSRELLHVIMGRNRVGTLIYTKGKLVRTGGDYVYYLLVSSKRAF